MQNSPTPAEIDALFNNDDLKSSGPRPLKLFICQTNRFYEMTREKLDRALGGVYKKLGFHFKDMMGVGNNCYLESIEKNMAYLSRIVASNEAELFTMLRRNGVVEKSRKFARKRI